MKKFIFEIDLVKINQKLKKKFALKNSLKGFHFQEIIHPKQVKSLPLRSKKCDESF